jgi:hypothetical protein
MGQALAIPKTRLVELDDVDPTGLSDGYALVYSVSLSKWGPQLITGGGGGGLTVEDVQDVVGAMLQNGTGITLVYNDAAGTETPTVTLAGFTTTNLSEGTNQYFTNERVDDRVAALLQNGTGISWTYDDAGNTLTPAVSLATFTTTDLAEGANQYFTNERVDDRVAALLQNGTGISWSYNDAANTLIPAVSLASFSTTDLTEGGNLYFTNARADARITAANLAPAVHTHTLSQITDAGTAASRNTGTGANNVPILDSGGKLATAVLPALAITDTFVVASQAAMLALSAQTGDVAVRTDENKSYILRGTDPTTLSEWELLRTPTDLVTSVNSQTGSVVLSTSDISEGTNQYFTNERVDDRVAVLLQNGTGISWSYNDASNTLTPTISLASFSTTDLSEGTNLYYTDTRADARITAAGLAPKTPQFVTLAAHAGLDNERVLTGTANQITLTDGGAGGNITLALPQDIATTSAPSFSGLTLTKRPIVTVQTLTVTANACTPNADNQSNMEVTNGANLTVNNPSGTPNNMQAFTLRINNSGGSAITISLGTIYRFGTLITALSQVAAGKANYITFRYDSTDTKWDVVAEVPGF